MSVVKMAGGVAPFYRVQEAMEGSGGGRPARWVSSPSVFEGFKRRGRGFDGVWLGEGKGRDSATAWLLVVYRRGAVHNGGG
jgi:hypothetical protein